MSPSPPTSPGAREYTIKITSSVPGQEVEFEGAYMFDGSEPALHVVRQATPFEVRVDGELGAGMFRKTGGDGQLVVEVEATESGKRVNAHRSQADGVIFGHNLLDGVSTFSRSYGRVRP